MSIWKTCSPRLARTYAGYDGGTHEVDRAKKRKILVLTALIAALALGVYLLLANAVFIVRDVRVEGNVNIDSDSIIRAAQLPLGKPMREVSEEKARAALESGGLVELVGLEKRYPDQVVLNVRERECEAVVSYAGVILTMERDGTVIEQLDALPETDAVYVTGLTVTAFRPGEVISAPASQLEAMVTTLEALYENGATGYVSELNVSVPNDTLPLLAHRHARRSWQPREHGQQGRLDGRGAARP